MPSIYAHTRFAGQAQKEFPEELRRSIRRFPQLFQFGAQGADFFFFYQPLFSTKIGNLGGWFHDLTGQEFFQRAAAHYSDSPSEGAKVYLYGVLCHYALDSVCHPLIVQASSGKNPGHTELEVELDRVLLARDGKNPPYRQNLAQELHLTWGECATVAGFYAPTSTAQVRRSARVMALVYRVLAAKNRRLLQRIFRLGGEYGAQMVMGAVSNPRCAEFIPELEARYENALALMPDLAAQLEGLLRGSGELGEAFAPNFSGNPIEQKKEERKEL